MNPTVQWSGRPQVGLTKEMSHFQVYVMIIVRSVSGVFHDINSYAGLCTKYLK